MAEQIKLTTAGDSLTFQCTGASLAKTGKWPEAIFAGHDGEKQIEVHMPAQSAERQLTRLAMTYAECGGKTLTISRAPNQSDPSKPYWNLEVVGTHAKKAQPFDQPVPPQIGSVATHESGAMTSRDLYADLTDWVLNEIVEKYTDRRIPLDASAIASMVATLYIQASKR